MEAGTGRQGLDWAGPHTGLGWDRMGMTGADIWRLQWHGCVVTEHPSQAAVACRFGHGHEPARKNHTHTTPPHPPPLKQSRLPLLPRMPPLSLSSSQHGPSLPGLPPSLLFSCLLPCLLFPSPVPSLYYTCLLPPPLFHTCLPTFPFYLPAVYVLSNLLILYPALCAILSPVSGLEGEVSAFSSLPLPFCLPNL